MVRCILCVCLWLGLSAGHARVRAQPAPVFDPAPIEALQIRAVESPPATLRASEVAAPPLRATGSVDRPALRAQSAGNPALAAEVARLRSTALSPVAQPDSASPAQANAAWVLGLLYLHGIGVAASPREAATWFERAHALGEPLAPAGLAWCEIEGCKDAPNPAAAGRWITLLRAVDLPRAQYLQWLVEARLSPLQIAAPGLRSEPAATGLPNRQLLLGAAQGGDIHARIELGLESITANRPAEALAHFRAAAPRSPAASANQALLSERLRSTSNARQPPATTSSSSADTFARAQRNHRGDGQPANFVEAIRLYRLAQSQGSVEARKMLELIFSRPAPDGQIDIAWMQQLAYVNLSKDAVTLDSATVRRALRREPTPLVDLLPQTWRKYASTTPR